MSENTTAAAEPSTLPAQEQEEHSADVTPEKVSSPTSSSSGSLLKLAFYGLAAIVAVFVVSNGITWLLSNPIASLNLPVANHHIVSMVYSATIIGVTVIVAKLVAPRIGGSIRSILFGVFNPMLSYRYLWSGLLGAVALMVISVGSTMLAGGKPPVEAVAPYQVMNLPTLLAYLGFTVALAPIAEEMLFRGVLMSAVRNSVIPGAKVLMVLLSSLGFMAYHVAGTLLTSFNLAVSLGSMDIFTGTLFSIAPQVLMYVLSGIALCFLALKTQNIYASWIAHAVYNLALLYGVNGMIASLLIS
jgi:membrane protease YdiL (CAAX protease family)